MSVQFSNLNAKDYVYKQAKVGVARGIKKTNLKKLNFQFWKKSNFLPYVTPAIGSQKNVSQFGPVKANIQIDIYEQKLYY